MNFTSAFSPRTPFTKYQHPVTPSTAQIDKNVQQASIPAQSVHVPMPPPDPNGPSIEENSSALSRLFLFYLSPLINEGNKRDLVLADLGPPSIQDRTVPIFRKFTNFWQQELMLKPEKRSLWFVLWRTCSWTRMWLAITLYAGSAAASFGPPLLLNQIVQHLSGTLSLPASTLWIYVALMFVLPMASSVLVAQSNIVMAHAGIQMRNSLVSMIYRKALLMSPGSRQQQSTGMVVNMFSNDTKQLQNFLYFFCNVVVAPLQIVIAIILIYLQVGPATFVGLGLMISSIPLNFKIFSMLQEYRGRKVKKTDIRVKLMNEILAGIRVIKFYAWELAFQKQVVVAREAELELLRWMAYIVAFGFTLILQALPAIQPVLVFYTYVKLGNNLTAATAFTTISFFNLLQFPFAFLPLGLAQYSQSLVSTQRMLKFFISDELTAYVDRSDPDDGTVITLKGATLGWVNEDESGAGAGGNDKGTLSNSKPSLSIIGDVVNGEDKENKLPKVYSAVKTTDIDPEESKQDPIAVTETATTADDKLVEVAIDDSTHMGIASEVLLTPFASLNRSVYTLVDMNLQIKRGQLLAVVGAVGSGKSSFLAALLGEMNLLSGSVALYGSVAYCEQRPWILNATVEDNILFGEPMNRRRMDAAVFAASLEDDIKVLPGGMQTEIGERGINLSGGQKARVSLARAVYKNSDIYLLDDPLSAVDAHVGQHIFRQCIRGALRGKTRILVTHQIHLLNQCDMVIVLENGRIKAAGSYATLQMSGLDITAFIPTDANATQPLEGLDPQQLLGLSRDASAEWSAGGISRRDDGIETKAIGDADKETVGVGLPVDPEEESAEGTKNEELDTSKPIVKPLSRPLESQQSIGIVGGGKTDPALLDMSSPEDSVQMDKAAKDAALARQKDVRSAKLLTIEERNTGDVETRAYIYFIWAGGIFSFTMMMSFLLFSQGALVGAQFQLAAWGAETAQGEANGNPTSNDEQLSQVGTYAWISCIALVCLTVRAVFLANHRINVSGQVHQALITRVLNAPIAFFDVTPIGRILNRFSSDLLVIDEELNQTIGQLSNSFANLLGALVIIAISTKGTFLALMVPLYYLNKLIQKKFQQTNTNIARLESISRSPIYIDFSAALVGAQSIRAYGEQDRFVRRLEECVDKNTSAAVLSLLASNWLAIRLDLLGSAISFFIVCLAVGSPGFIPAEYVAIGLSSSFQVTTYLKFFVRMSAQLEAQFNSVERVQNYSEKVVQEDDPNDESSLRLVDPATLPKDWPAVGEIRGQGIMMAYRDGPLVLKGVDFEVAGGEKIGIAGRTGSGKSSLMIALFRIQELAGGSIYIDGVDITTVPVRFLRHRLGIIPQDPVMFSKPVRFNLDPFNEHTDVDIWEILESVDMKRHVESLPNRLLEDVAEGGDNFSAGQRQLICIARALLRRPKILVLDEATASIDNETDALVQRTVKNSFKECTVLTIAHRLNTIIDSDKIMVLDAGMLAEMDTPATLLAKEGSVFRSLWERHQASHQDGTHGNTEGISSGH